MISYILLWKEFIKTAVAQRMAYRGEFLISIIAMLVTEITPVIFAYTIYYNSPGFLGWTFYEILLLQGSLLLVKGISFPFFFGIVWNSNITLQQGRFDLFLIKPRNVLANFVFSSFDTEDLGKLLGGLILVTIALSHFPSITLLNIILYALSILFGTLVFFGMAVLLSAFIFQFIQTWRVYEFLDIILLFGQYPKSIYAKSVGSLFTGFIPIFMASYYPVQILKNVFSQSLIFGMVGTIIFVTISVFIWFKVIRNYASAGG